MFEKMRQAIDERKKMKKSLKIEGPIMVSNNKLEELCRLKIEGSRKSLELTKVLRDRFVRRLEAEKKNKK